MATLAEFIKKTAEKSGVDTNTEEFKAIFETTTKLELPENTDLLSAYLLKSDAKNDPEIKSHYFGQFGDQAERILLREFEDIGLSKEVLEEIKKAEPSTFKKIGLLSVKTKELIAQKADPSILKGEKAEIQRMLDEALHEKKSLIETYENEKQILANRIESDNLNYIVKDASRGFKIIDSIPPQYRDSVLMQSISRSMEDHGVKLVLRDGKATLVNNKDTSLAAKDGITLNSIIEKGFANDKLLDLGKGAEGEEVDTTRQKTTRIEVNQGASTVQRNLALAKQAMGV